MIGFDNEFSAFVFSAEPPQKRRGTSHIFTLTNAWASVKNVRGPCCAIANPSAEQRSVEKIGNRSNRLSGKVGNCGEIACMYERWFSYV